MPTKKTNGVKSYPNELQEEIRDRVYIKKQTVQQVSNELNLPTQAISRVLIGDYWKHKDDTKIAQILKADSTVSALDIIDNLFMSLMLSAKELQYNGILSMEIREKISEIISEEGVEGLVKDEANAKLLNEYRKTTDAISKLSTNANTYVNTYLTVFRDILDAQRELAYVRVVHDVLKKLSPEIAAQLSRGLLEDPVTKALMNKISTEDIQGYFVTGDSVAATINKKTLNMEDRKDNADSE